MKRGPFQRKSVLDRAPGSGVPNMTPMVDVTLVILIFFMASATIAGPEWFLNAQLPEDAPVPPGALSLPSPVVRVEIFARDGVTLVRGIGPEQTLRGALDAIEGLDDEVSGGLSVEIHAGDDVEYADVARLHGALVARGAGVRMRVQ